MSLLLQLAIKKHVEGAHQAELAILTTINFPASDKMLFKILSYFNLESDMAESYCLALLRTAIRSPVSR